MPHGENAERQYGKECWAKRPFNIGGGPLGSFHKFRTHKKERKDGKLDIQYQLINMGIFY
jgi:hypothetical protein